MGGAPPFPVAAVDTPPPDGLNGGSFRDRRPIP